MPLLNQRAEKLALLEALNEKERRLAKLQSEREAIITIDAKTYLHPQPGGQQAFFDTKADICFFGGKAGSGKTWSIIAEPMRHVEDPLYTCVIFRRTSPQIRNPGGLWDESMTLYPKFNGEDHRSVLEWEFPSHAKVKMASMQYEADKYDWQGSQICGIFFDEVTHFSKDQFFYMLSRNRSMCSVRPYMRATCNPDADSWVSGFISWWIDPQTGFAIPERSGVLRWFVRLQDEIIWGDSPDDLIKKYSTDRETVDPKSVTFIVGDLNENKALIENNPGYVGMLEAMPFVERARLKDGNWKIRAGGGNIFKLEWFERAPRWRIIPADCERLTRYWDLGGSDSPKADFTVGMLMGKRPNKRYPILDIKRGQWSANERKAQILRTLAQDKRDFGGKVKTLIEWVPGIGSAVIDDLIEAGMGYDIHKDHPEGKKHFRAMPVSAALEAGYIELPESAPWLDAFINECIGFSDNPKDYWKDDQVDTFSGDFNDLSSDGESFSIGSYYPPKEKPKDDDEPKKQSFSDIVNQIERRRNAQ